MTRSPRHSITATGALLFALLGVALPSMAYAEESSPQLDLGAWSAAAAGGVNTAAVLKLASTEQSAAVKAANAAKSCAATSRSASEHTASGSGNIPDFGPFILGAHDVMCSNYYAGGLAPWTSRDITGMSWAMYLGDSTASSVCVYDYFKFKSINGSVSIPPSASLENGNPSNYTHCSSDTYYAISSYDGVHYGNVVILTSSHEVVGYFAFRGFAWNYSASWNTVV